MASINFFSEAISFKLKHPRKTSGWIKSTIKREKKSLEQLNFIFCSDEYLLEINKAYLKHNTFTDIITFNQSTIENIIEGDVYLSVDRIKENALSMNIPFDDEIHRVIIHGVLHLIGYDDKSKAAKSLMRKKEDFYLATR